MKWEIITYNTSTTKAAASDKTHFNICSGKFENVAMKIRLNERWQKLFAAITAKHTMSSLRPIRKKCLMINGNKFFLKNSFIENKFIRNFLKNYRCQTFVKFIFCDENLLKFGLRLVIKMQKQESEISQKKFFGNIFFPQRKFLI